MNRLYICNTIYHIFIALVREIKNKGDSDLLIYSTNLDNNNISNKLINRIKRSRIFNKIYIVELDNFLELSNCSKLEMFKRYLKNYRNVRIEADKIKIDFSKYSFVYIGLDTSWMGKILNYKKVSYVILEDGEDCFLYYPKYHVYTKRWILLEKLFYGYVRVGESKRCRYIIVNNSKDIIYNYNKFVEEKKSDLFSKLDSDDKKILLKIFNCHPIRTNNSKCALLITQPLFIDHDIESISEMIKLYQYIIDNYCMGYQVIIKVHPREVIDYKKYFKKCIIIKDKYPIELLSFYDNIEISRAVTVFSTAINSLNFIDDRITLGLDWLLDYRTRKM